MLLQDLVRQEGPLCGAHFKFAIFVAGSPMWVLFSECLFLRSGGAVADPRAMLTALMALPCVERSAWWSKLLNVNACIRHFHGTDSEERSWEARAAETKGQLLKKLYTKK